MITKEELAATLNGREYGNEITKGEEILAKQNGLVVMFGYSDDNVELRGAIDDEIGAYDGTTISFLNGEILQNECGEEECPYFQKLKESPAVKTVEAIWDNGEYNWTFKTDIPHATFEVLEDGEKFCRGIVFDVAEIQEAKKELTEQYKFAQEQRDKLLATCGGRELSSISEEEKADIERLSDEWRGNPFKITAWYILKGFNIFAK